MSEKPLPILLLWVRDIGLDENLLRCRTPYLSLRRKTW
jgi:hypothetical protein